MENPELLTAWAELQNRVELSTSVAVRRASEGELRRLRGRIARSPAVDVVLSILMTGIIGNFVADHLDAFSTSPIALLPAVILFLFAVGVLNAGIRQLILGSTLDNYAAPVMEAQASLAALRKLRVRSTQWIFSAALALWVLFPILLGQMLINVKFIYALSPAWIGGNVAFGVAMLPVVDWFMRKSRFAGSLRDAITGRDIAEAEALLKEVEKFQAA